MEKDEKILKLISISMSAGVERKSTSCKIRQLIKALEVVNDERAYSTNSSLTDEKFIECFDAIGPLVRTLLEDEKNRIEEIKKNSGLV